MPSIIASQLLRVSVSLWLPSGDLLKRILRFELDLLRHQLGHSPLIQLERHVVHTANTWEVLLRCPCGIGHGHSLPWADSRVVQGRLVGYLLKHSVELVRVDRFRIPQRLRSAAIQEGQTYIDHGSDGVEDLVTDHAVHVPLAGAELLERRVGLFNLVL